MALTTNTELKAAVATRMRRSDLTTNIVDYVAQFEAKLNRRLRVRKMVTTTSLTPSSGSVALPTDYLDWLRVTWTGSPNRQLDFFPPDAFWSLHPGQTGTPNIFTIEGAALKVAPASTTAVTFAYYQAIPALASASTNWLLTAHPDLYLYGVTAEGFADIRNWEAAKANGMLADACLQEVINLDAATNQIAPGHINKPAPFMPPTLGQG